MSQAKGLPPLKDVSTEEARRQMTQNVINMYRASSPRARQRGEHWMESANSSIVAASKGKSLTPFHQAGLVAAVSPNMDWESHNVHALDELHNLKSKDWKVLSESAAGPKRTPEAQSVLAGRSISRSTDSALMDAHRILQGENPDEVLTRQGSLKRNSFLHNLDLHQTWNQIRPNEPHPVTIDGRIHDELENVMRPWGMDRRIGGRRPADMRRAGHFMDAIRTASPIVSELHGREVQPHQVMSMIWEGGKELERSGTTLKGTPRLKGPTRKGQPYL